MKNILVTGSSGFIGGHLIAKLCSINGNAVFGVDIEEPKYLVAMPHEFIKADLRHQYTVDKIFEKLHFDEVYNLACLMGGMGYISNHDNDFDIMVGSSQIVLNIADACVDHKVKKLFYSSSACVYNMNLQNKSNAKALKETDAYPALPDLEYGWQKVFSERVYIALLTKGIDVKIARFHNIFGPFGTWNGGKEKAPAALCRKVAQAKDGDSIEVWGDGKQTRSFLYIDEALEGVERLMNSDFNYPINIGSDEMVSINHLAEMIIKISGKNLTINNIPSDKVGVQGRNSDNLLIKRTLKWKPTAKLYDGLVKTYEWINKQVNG